MAEAQASPPTTRDAFLGGRLILEQPAKGHRAGTDAVLLTAAVPHSFVGHVYDAGAGVGTVGLAIALASPHATVTLIENDPASAALAAANIAANGLDARVTVAACDLLSSENRSRLAPADLVVSNPPFHEAGRVRASPDPGRRAAHVLAPKGLEGWLLACLALLDAKGTLVIIHQPAALPDMLRTFGARLGGLTVKAVHPHAGAPAVRVLVRGTKGSRAPLRIAAPLVLHDADGFTEEASRLHAGMAQLKW